MNNYQLSSVHETNLTNQNGVYQDSLLTYAADRSGRFWALLGHTNLGGISVWSGSSLLDLKKEYDAQYCFALGEAGQAFSGIPYPDGPLSRGQIWPCGLWINKETNRFYCLIHNETGWGAGKTSYTARAQEEGEPDFRHIGMMTSDDCGRTWRFFSWILTAQEPCWTSRFSPGMNQPGQTGDEICLGCGDFSVFPNPHDGYLYLFYTKHFTNLERSEAVTDAVYLARCRLDELEDVTAWRKYTGNGFTEPGNCGRDVPVLIGGAIPSVCKDPAHDRFVMSTYNRDAWQNGLCTCQLSFSEDLLHWTKPEHIAVKRADVSNPYLTLYPEGTSFRVFMSANGTDIRWYTLTLNEG